MPGWLQGLNSICGMRKKINDAVEGRCDTPGEYPWLLLPDKWSLQLSPQDGVRPHPLLAQLPAMFSRHLSNSMASPKKKLQGLVAATITPMTEHG